MYKYEKCSNGNIMSKDIANQIQERADILKLKGNEIFTDLQKQLNNASADFIRQATKITELKKQIKRRDIELKEMRHDLNHACSLVAKYQAKRWFSWVKRVIRKVTKKGQ